MPGQVASYLTIASLKAEQSPPGCAVVLGYSSPGDGGSVGILRVTDNSGFPPGRTAWNLFRDARSDTNYPGAFQVDAKSANTRIDAGPSAQISRL